MALLKTQSSLSKSDLLKLSSFIYQESGIKMPDSKKVMVEARLRKRLRELNLPTYEEYIKYLFSKEGTENEIVHMVDVITTNKTDFFREPRQFEFLFETGLPEIKRKIESGAPRDVNVWSAGCSSGEEPYTLAIVLNEFGIENPGFKYNILATDISTRVLDKAETGVYDTERIEPIPEVLVKKYFLRSKDPAKKLVRVVPALRNKIHFQRLNFMDSDYQRKDKFDIIFCRNVIIYFDKPTQDKVISRLVQHLMPGGYLFLGHSESIFNVDLPLVQLAPSTYRKTI